MVTKLMKFLSNQLSTSHPSNLRYRVLDILGGTVRSVTFRYEPGQEVQDKVAMGESGLGRKYRIDEQKVFSRQPYYTLIEVATGEELGVFHEDSLEPYGPTPIPQPGQTQ